MSEHWLRIIPRDPQYIPDELSRARLRAEAQRLLPGTQTVEEEVSDGVQFLDAGANWSGVACPACRAKICDDWWIKAMEADFDEASGFALAPVDLPCCPARIALDGLDYDWEVGFARYLLDLENDTIGVVSPEIMTRLEEAARCRLKIIYQHI